MRTKHHCKFSTNSVTSSSVKAKNCDSWPIHHYNARQDQSYNRMIKDLACTVAVLIKQWYLHSPMTLNDLSIVISTTILQMSLGPISKKNITNIAY